VLGGAVLTMGAAAAATPTTSGTAGFVQVNTTYPHPDEGGQGVLVRVTVAPEERITDVYVNVSDSQSGFVDFSEEFSREIRAGTISSVPNEDKVVRSSIIRSFYLSELEGGDTVTISFTAYPQRLDAESLDVATIRYQYVRNGQQIPADPPGRIAARADLTESPHFALQAAERRASSLQQRITGMWGIVGLGALLGVVGVGLFAYARLSGGDDGVDRSWIVDELHDIKRRTEGTTQNRVQQTIDAVTSADGGTERGGGSGPAGEGPDTTGGSANATGGTADTDATAGGDTSGTRDPDDDGKLM